MGIAHRWMHTTRFSFTHSSGSCYYYYWHTPKKLPSGNYCIHQVYQFQLPCDIERASIPSAGWLRVSEVRTKHQLLIRQTNLAIREDSPPAPTSQTPEPSPQYLGHAFPCPHFIKENGLTWVKDKKGLISGYHIKIEATFSNKNKFHWNFTA